MKFQGNTKEAGINGFQAIIRLGNSDERLGLDKIIADQKSRLDGPRASAGSRHDGIRGLELLDCSPAWRCGSCCRRRWPPSSWITIWDRRNQPPEKERGRETWVVGDQIPRTRARDSGNELLFGLLFAEEIWDAELLASSVVLVWRVVLAPRLLRFLILL